MALVRDEIMWGATIDAPPRPNHDVREWTVEVESAPLDDVAADDVLTRFAYDAARRAPAAAPACSVTSGRLAMVLTIEAPCSGEAARKGSQVFELALGTALWPRSVVEPFGTYDVTVAPVRAIAHAA